MPVATRDGRSLFAERHGVGEPVVVFEAGMGASRSTWGGVLDLVSPHTTAVAYDRSGLGCSAPHLGRRDLAQLTDDLLDLLDTVGDGPFVLVGHSWGGPIVRSAAARRPDVVAALVLVDQTDERCPLFFEDGAERQTRLARRILPLAARLGLVRMIARRLAKPLPEPWRRAMRTEDGTVSAVREQLAELEHHIDDLRRLRDAPLELPDVPVTVISGGRHGLGERKRRPELLQAHRATAAASPQGRHVVATASTHYVPLTEPDVVATEILTIVNHP